MGVHVITTPVINEQTTGLLRFQLVDEAGAHFALAGLLTLTLTSYDKVSGNILNARDNQNVKNANNVTISATGLVTWHLQPDDTVIVWDTVGSEVHVAFFEWTWNGGQQSVELYYTVRNLVKVL